MNRTYSTRWLVAAMLLALALGGAHAQEQEGEYKPFVGQPGKDVVWVPTEENLVEKMLDLAQVTPGDYVIDLGSGDGRTVIAAAKRGAVAHGIEFNPDLVALSRRNAIEAEVTDKATFVTADIFESDISTATVITMFLLPDINLKLRPILLDLKPGTRIVSNSFTMQDWKADETVNVGAECKTWCTAYLWIVPAKVEGKWRVPDGEMDLSQQYQNITGTLTLNGKSRPIAGELKGDRINIKAGDMQYSGRIKGHTISGTLVTATGKRNWKATKQEEAVLPIASGQ
jgi:hypothetical protein